MNNKEDKEYRHYKIHIAYIDMNGVIIKPGIYREDLIDIAEARMKTIMTLEDVEIALTASNIEIAMPVQKFNMSLDYKETEILPELTEVKIEKIYINECSEDELAAIKYVGKTSAKKVIIERSKTPFISYIDLDSRCPLISKKSWIDICAIDFKHDKLLPNLIEYI